MYQGQLFLSTKNITQGDTKKVDREKLGNSRI